MNQNRDFAAPLNDAYQGGVELFSAPGARQRKLDTEATRLIFLGEDIKSES